MDITVKQRLTLFIKNKGLSQGKFESIAGLSNGYINNVKGSIGANSLQKIFRAFPELNQKWLLSGEGEMLIDSMQQSGNGNVQVGGNAHNVNAGETIDRLVALLEKKDEQIDRLLSLLEKSSN